MLYKEEGWRRYFNLTNEYVKLDRKLVSLLPPMSNLSAGKLLKSWTPTKEEKEEIDNLRFQIYEIRHKRDELLAQLIQP